MDDLRAAQLLSQAQEAVRVLKLKIPDTLKALRVGIVCGSGLGGLADAVSDPRAEVPYSDIPFFPKSTVQGHAGKLLFGLLGANRCPVVLMVGRAHFYEGHSIRDVTFPIRVLKLLGIDILIVTNAAGGLNPTYAVGDLVVLSDHLNLAGLAGVHPLRGPNVDDFGVRFPPLSDAYDLDLRVRAHRAWTTLNTSSRNRKLHEGVYAFVGGPSYETRAECRMLRSLGADLVGMSTVPEIVVARHSGIRILALSLVTNNAVLETGPRGNDVRFRDLSSEDLVGILEKGKANHEEVLEAGRQAAQDMQKLVCFFVQDLTSPR